MSPTANLNTEEETAEVLHVGIPTLRRWRQIRTGPAYVKLGRRIFYTDEDLAAYVKSQRMEPVNARAAG